MDYSSCAAGGKISTFLQGNNIHKLKSQQKMYEKNMEASIKKSIMTGCSKESMWPLMQFSKKIYLISAINIGGNG